MPIAVIFDLDGTLTVPVLDFDAIRAEVGLGPGPILEAMSGMSEAQRARVEEVLDRHERQAALGSVLQEGTADTIAALRRCGCKTAVLTRNVRRWARVVLDQHGLEMDALRGRDDGAVKPSAEPVLALLEQLGCAPNESWMVGDYLFDIQAGREAGCTTVLMLGDKPIPAYADQADRVIRRLPELLELIGNSE